jgi:DNA-binding CsgD family transcriptional regulator
LADAGRHALREGAPEAAATLLERSLAEPAPAAERPALLLALGEAEHALERVTARERLREAYAVAGDPRDRARAALLLTWAVVSGADAPRDLEELIDGAIAGLPSEERDLALRLEAAWLELAWDRSRLDALLERGVRFTDLRGETAGECLVLMQLAHAWVDAGRPAADVAHLAERAARREFVPDLAANSLWLIHANVALAATERFATLVPLYDVAVADAQRRGSHRAYLLASMCRAAAHFSVGDVNASLADSSAALAGDARDAIHVPAVGIVASGLVAQGRLDEAERLLEEHGLDGDVPEFRHGTLVLGIRARVRAARGDHRGALADLTEARSRLDRAGRENVVGLDGRVGTALAQLALGRRDVAEREATLALEAAQRWGTPGAVGESLRALGLVRGDLEALEAAVELLAGSPFGLRHARALVDLGAALRRAGHRADSRAPLREAYAIADRGGAIVERERAREELAASGVRVRRAAERGLAALTPSERRIAARAAAGASNPEIAQELFVTVKTVEMHLSNAYRKLGIVGRRELERALR